MQPESSNGFASVGTILPEEGAALLPGGSFRFCVRWPSWLCANPEVAQHGPDDYHYCHRDRGPDARPEPDAAERKQNAGPLVVDVEAEVIRQQGSHGHGKEDSAGPYDGDAEG